VEPCESAVKPLLKILCVDDHPVVRRGVAAMLAVEPDMAPADLAANGHEARQLVAERRPDIVLLDFRLRDEDGIDLGVALRALVPAAKLVIMTTYAGDEPAHRALQAGVQGYLLKDSLDRELVTALRAVLAGRRYVQGEVARQLAESGPRVVLTTREREVLSLLSEGLRNKVIAQRLGVGETTVRSHVEAILAKFGVQDRTAAVSQAMRRGFLHVG
jgi:DNA-binding NarL/FixJ family response regulator